MEAKYIVMIVIGCVFALLLIIYFVYQIGRTNEYLHDERVRQIYYSSKNLNKMEYDIAFPSTTSAATQSGEQVTMDEIFNESSTNFDFKIPVINIGELEGSKTIIGTFNQNVGD